MAPDAADRQSCSGYGALEHEESCVAGRRADDGTAAVAGGESTSRASARQLKRAGRSFVVASVTAVAVVAAVTGRAAWQRHAAGLAGEESGMSLASASTPPPPYGILAAPNSAAPAPKSVSGAVPGPQSASASDASEGNSADGDTAEEASAATDDAELGAGATLAGSPQPHIILVTIDDAGWNDVGYQSTDLFEVTPHMNKLAAGGVTLDQYYGQPSCSPSRATLMTGRWVHRIGFQDTEIQAYSNYSIPLRHQMMPQYLKALGYSTVGLGKWNIGHCAEEYLPWNRGFDYFLGYMTAALDYRTRAVGLNFSHGGENYALYDQLEGYSTGHWHGAAWTIENQKYDTVLYSKAAVKAINSAGDDAVAAKAVGNSSTPLFLWVAYHGVHADDNADVTDGDLGSGKQLEAIAEKLEAAGASSGRLAFAKALFAIDHGVGEIVESSVSNGGLNNTLIVVHSDNGGMPCTYGGKSADLPGNNWPLRSGKFQYYEGGVRIPAFVYGPGLIPDAAVGRTYSGLMHHVDWLPTFVSVAGGHVPPDDLDGIDQWAALRDVALPQDGPRDEIVFDISLASMNKSNGLDEAPVDMRVPYVDGVVAYRYREMKLLRRHTDDVWYAPSTKWKPNCTAQYCQMNKEYEIVHRCGWDTFLFNLTEDPEERNNLVLDANLLKLRSELETRVRRHYQKGYYQPLDKESRSTTLANHAFFKAGGVVAPWGGSEESGCAVVY